MSKHYSINKLCQMTKLSVRTLHYYDEINLLKPSYRSAKGHRLYSEIDLLKLQKIVTFRFLGFTLTQIKLIIKNDHKNTLDLVKLQAEAIAEEAARIDKVSKFFNYLISQYEVHDQIDWETTTAIIAALQQKGTNSEAWYEKYLSTSEKNHFSQFVKTRTDKWLALFAEVRAHLHTNPQSETGLSLVAKWIQLADEAYGQQPALRQKLWQAYQSGLIPNDFFPYDKDVIQYLTLAFEYGGQI